MRTQICLPLVQLSPAKCIKIINSLLRSVMKQATDYEPPMVIAFSATFNCAAVNDNLFLQRNQIYVYNKI